MSYIPYYYAHNIIIRNPFRCPVMEVIFGFRFVFKSVANDWTNREKNTTKYPKMGRLQQQKETKTTTKKKRRRNVHVELSDEGWALQVVKGIWRPTENTRRYNSVQWEYSVHRNKFRQRLLLADGVGRMEMETRTIGKERESERPEGSEKNAIAAEYINNKTHSQNVHTINRSTSPKYPKQRRKNWIRRFVCVLCTYEIEPQRKYKESLARRMQDAGECWQTWKFQRHTHTNII